MRLKPELEQTCARFDAWWDGEVLDRPLVTTRMKPVRAYEGPTRQHASLRGRWLDVDYQVEAALAQLRRCDYPGEALPCWMPNVGPELTATLLGCELEFSETTSWTEPIVDDISGWAAIADREPDFTNIYWQTIERMTALALEVFAGEAMVGVADLHGNYDILAGLRDPQMLCLDLLDDPEAVRRAAGAAVRCLTAGLHRLHEPIAATGQPATTWLPYCARELAYVPSCDFWCMVGPDMAQDLVLPTIVTEMESMQRSIFHLDGPQALPHLDLLLDLPQLDAVQWVYGAGQGPATKWIDVYRRILAAGKSIYVHAYDATDALAVIDQVGVAGVWLDIMAPFDSADDAEDFLNQLKKANHVA